MNKEIKKELTMPSKPTETRPPRLFCTRCGYQIGGTICTKCRQVPRAAAPVEPPKFWDCLTCGYNNNGSDILCGDCGRAKGLPDANLAATPVEPSPRHTDQCPQPGYVDETQVEVEQAPRAQSRRPAYRSPQLCSNCHEPIGNPETHLAECVPPSDWALIAAEKIFALFKNASYFSTRNSEHKQQMVEGWAEIIRASQRTEGEGQHGEKG